MMKYLFALLFVCASLSGCVYDQHPRHPHADGHFCPPGQAKKGRC